MASINDLSLAKGLTAKVEEACTGLETGEAPILDHVSEITAELLNRHCPAHPARHLCSGDRNPEIERRSAQPECP